MNRPARALFLLATLATALVAGGCAALLGRERTGTGTYYRPAPPNAGITLSLKGDGAYEIVYTAASGVDEQVREYSEDGVWTLAGTRVALHPRTESRDARFDAWRALYLGHMEGNRVLFLADPGRGGPTEAAFVEWRERRRPPPSRPH